MWVVELLNNVYGLQYYKFASQREAEQYASQCEEDGWETLVYPEF